MKQTKTNAPRAHFEEPRLEILFLDHADIITTSAGEQPPVSDENWGEWEPYIPPTGNVSL